MSSAGAGQGGLGRPSVQVLADRMAVALTRREPGYPLPRRTALARRFQASEAEIDAAIEELIHRQLLRRLPTGEVHRAGPAEYLVSLDHLPGLSSFIDPMDHVLAFTAVRISRLRAPADVADVLRLEPGSQVNLRRCLWTADGRPAAAAASYVPDEHAGLITASPAAADDARAVEPSPAKALVLPGLTGKRDDSVWAGAVGIEVQPPPRSVARRLRLTSGAPAVIVTVRLDGSRRENMGPEHEGEPDSDGGRAEPVPPRSVAQGPVALTVLTLRPELFRVVLETASAGAPSRWTAHRKGIELSAAHRGG